MSGARYDVLVVGAGSAGTTAAVAAARAGARTLLVDRFGFLGGTSTAVLDTFYAFYTPGRHPEKVVSGIPDEVVARLTERGMAFERPNTYGAGTGITYDPETLKRVWDELTTEAGVRTLLHTFAFGVSVEDGRVIGVEVATKSGVRRLRASVVVDASGDADVCALAGAPFEPPGEGVQSLSTVFRMATGYVTATTTPATCWWPLAEPLSSIGVQLHGARRKRTMPGPCYCCGGRTHCPEHPSCRGRSSQPGGHCSPAPTSARTGVGRRHRRGRTRGSSSRPLLG